MAPFSKEQLLALLQDDRTRLKLAGPNVAALAELAAPSAVREPAVETATPAPVVQPVASKPRLDELVGIPTQSPQDDLEAQLRKYLQLQQSGVEENQAALKNYLAQEPRVDWAPLIALADAETGSNILRGYTRPPSPEERAKTEQELRNVINNQQGDIVRTLAGLQSSKANARALKEAGTQGRYDENKLLQKENAIGDFLTKEISKPLEEAAYGFDILDTALASGDYNQVMSVLSQYSRRVAGEKGVLTDRDLDKALPADLSRDFTKLQYYITADGKLDPKVLSGMVKLTKLAREKTAQKINQTLSSKKDFYSRSQSYKDMFVPGRSGDLIFSDYKNRINEMGGKGFAPQRKANSQPETKTVNGVTYKKVQGGWEAVD